MMNQTQVNPATLNPEAPEPVQPQRELTPGQQPEPEVPGEREDINIVPNPQIPEITPGGGDVEVPPLQ